MENNRSAGDKNRFKQGCQSFRVKKIENFNNKKQKVQILVFLGF